tara:strand:+ start:261 stop:458 length:198 start_codon:yes stop_codon:yes gene_type:complete
MSAPDTNVERQEKRHKPSLLGIRGAIIFGVVMVLLVILFSVMRGGDPAVSGSDVDVETVAPGTND